MNSKRASLQVKIATASIWMLFLNGSNLTAQSVEILAGHENTQGDIQWLKPFSAASKFLFYNRNRFTVDYENKTTYFISGITAYEIKNGFGVANEMLITSEGWITKFGLQYLNSTATFTAYVWLNSGYLKEFKYDFFSFIRYQPKINENWRYYFQLEVVSNFTKDGNEFSAQRPRLGVATKNIQFGLAGDFNQVGTQLNFLFNAGLFIRKEF